MKRQVLKIGSILSFIVIVPLIIMVSLELNTLSKNEKNLQTIYNNELLSILNSVNIYSEDVIRDWSSTISTIHEFNGNLINFLNEKKPIAYICSLGENSFSFYGSTPVKALKQELKANAEEHTPKLTQYLKSNYKKIERISLKNNQKYVQYIFVTKRANKTTTYSIVVDKYQFCSTILFQKIQSLMNENFYIEIKDSKGNTVLPLNSNRILKDAKLEKLWMIPGYKIGIEPLNSSLQNVIVNRNKNQILLVILLSAFIISGTLFIFYNIRKELKLAQIKSEFVSNVSHEIRTPLALISMYAETLEANRIRTEEKKQEYYKTICNETQRLTSMVNKILNFSGIEKGKRKFNMEDIEINTFISESLSSYIYQYSKSGVEIKLNTVKDNLLISADKEAVSEAILNIIDNGIKYNKNETKKIVIKTYVNGKYAVVQISDNGIGISPKHKKLIFDKFYRVTKGNLANNVKGSGIGLNIVKEIVKIHKGKIEVESTEGTGSKFRLLFPLLK